MRRVNTPDDSSMSESEPLGTRRAIVIVSYMVMAVVLFALGCFVVGPALNRTHPSKTVTVQSENDPIKTTAPETSCSHHSRAKVVITERPVDVAKQAQAQTEQRGDHSAEAPAAVPQEQQTESVGAAVPDTQSSQRADTPPVETDEPAASDTVTPTQLYRVRAGIFASRINADSLAAKLVSAGFAPAVYQVKHDDNMMFSVQLGAFRRRESADQLVSDVRKAGFEAVITTDK